MIRIILFLVLIALAAAGAAWVADQPGDVMLTWDGWRAHDLAAGVRAAARHRDRRGDARCGASCARCGACREKSAARRRERRHARGRHAITQGLLAIGHGDAAAARAHADVARKHAGNDPLALLLHAQSAQLDGDRAGAQRRVPRHGRARGHAAVGPARPVHRGAARRRSGLRGDDRRRSAEARALLDLGVAGRARIPLRQGRLERRAGDPRDQSCLRPDRQGDLPAPARRAADGARAGTGNARPRSVARQRDGSGQARADPGAGRRARQQIRERGASDRAARCASWRRRGWRSRIPISPMPMRM